MKEELFFSSSDSKEYIPKNGFYSSSDFNWTKNIEDNFAIIENEINIFLLENRKELLPYFSKGMVSKPNGWQTTGFYFWGLFNKSNIKKCPQTIKLIDTIPGVVSASISLMSAQTEIKGHRGDTNAIYRCHLPIKVPGSLPEIGFQVEEEQRNWTPGKFLIFNDAAYHKAWNNTDEERVILIIDVVKPEYVSNRIWICSRVLGGLYIHFLSEKIKYLRKKSFLKKILHYFFSFFAWLLLNLFFIRLFKK